MPTNEKDAELQAIGVLIKHLGPLDADARERVVKYVLGRFELRSMPPGQLGRRDVEPREFFQEELKPPKGTPRDIRSLKEEKAPRSQNEMAALVAFYLAELAPAGERKETINQDDVENYFKQAGHPLPKHGMTLVNAKNAGYLDSTSDPGEYRLNPVGYNLIAHALPRPSEATRRTKKTRRPLKKPKAARVKQES